MKVVIFIALTLAFMAQFYIVAGLIYKSGYKVFMTNNSYYYKMPILLSALCLINALNSYITNRVVRLGMNILDIVMIIYIILSVIYSIKVRLKERKENKEE